MTNALLRPLLRGGWYSLFLVVGLVFAAPACLLERRPPAAPARPGVIEGDGRIFVYWTPVASAAAYEVWTHTADNAQAAVKYGADRAAASVSIAGLPNDAACYVWIKAKNGAGSSGFSLGANGTPHAGASSARIYVSGTQFFINGNRIWMNGCNTPWDNWNDFGGNYNSAFWDTHYAALHGQGVNASRVWITCSGEVGITIDAAGYVSGATADHWADLDDFFAAAQRNGIYIMATLISFDHFKDTYPASNYQRWRAWIGSDANIDSYIDNYLIPFLQRYGSYPALWSIDLCNEPEWAMNTETGGTIDWSRFQTYFARAAKAIHENSDVLVTVGLAVIKYNSDAFAEGNKVKDSVLEALMSGDPDARLDFYSPHHYPWMIQWFGTPMYESPASYFGEAVAKPCVIGECPATGSDADPENELVADFENAYTNGWQGILPWTSNGVDGNGGFIELTPATSAFATNHPALVFP